MKVGDSVRILHGGSEFPWKQELVGLTGVVDEVSNNGKAVSVRLDRQADTAFPIWFPTKFVEVFGGVIR